MIPLRAQILKGDFSAAYIAWLGSLERGHVREGEKEPPVPPGLADLTEPVAALAELLRVDRDLIAAAGEGSAVRTNDTAAIRAWLKALPSADKDRWLCNAIDRPEAALGIELHAAFRKGRGGGESSVSRRSGGELLARAEELRAKREAAEAVAKERARVVAARARAKKLEHLSTRYEAAWNDLGTLVGSGAYDQAVELAVDLREIAQREGKQAEFDGCFAATKKNHARRRGFFTAFKEKTATKSLS